MGMRKIETRTAKLQSTLGSEATRRTNAGSADAASRTATGPERTGTRGRHGGAGTASAGRLLEVATHGHRHRRQVVTACIGHHAVSIPHAQVKKG